MVFINRPVPIAKKSMHILSFNRNRCPQTSTLRFFMYQKSNHLECLLNKSVLRLRGKESAEFLQGLTTNDMSIFKNGATNIYSLFLNTKGKLLFDTFIYKTPETNTFYIECDSNISEQLQEHLKIYKVRRKIDIEQIDNKVKIWTLYDMFEDTVNHISPSEQVETISNGLIFPCNMLNSEANKHIENIIYTDPRLPELGFRILCNSKFQKNDIQKFLNCNLYNFTTPYDYNVFRYKLGIGEGINDFPPKEAFPLESNFDYLHGISFHKGCYIGQELTARIYHTGVVRKRIMPIIFNEIPKKPILHNESIVDETGKIVEWLLYQVHRKLMLTMLKILSLMKILKRRNILVECLNVSIVV
ncbi:putative transferase CAF17 homolog, mitochondrial isoform X2 [Prorops nasuta]|uniref:putative transferase CAF17 homolog, mitochondrial isoform X2 n=1 Tax=Prorops nasuta TaxID=863751 RepID=UPI0034CD87B9